VRGGKTRQRVVNWHDKGKALRKKWGVKVSRRGKKAKSGDRKEGRQKKGRRKQNGPFRKGGVEKSGFPKPVKVFCAKKRRETGCEKEGREREDTGRGRVCDEKVRTFKVLLVKGGRVTVSLRYEEEKG